MAGCGKKHKTKAKRMAKGGAYKMRKGGCATKKYKK